MLCVTGEKSRKIERAERREDRLYLYSEAGVHRLEPKNDRTVRITYTQNEAFSEEEKPGIICREVFKDWDYREKGTDLCFYTKHVKIVINRETASFSYFDGEGKRLLREREQDSKTL